MSNLPECVYCKKVSDHNTQKCKKQFNRWWHKQYLWFRKLWFRVVRGYKPDKYSPRLIPASIEHFHPFQDRMDLACQLAKESMLKIPMKVFLQKYQTEEQVI